MGSYPEASLVYGINDGRHAESKGYYDDDFFYPRKRGMPKGIKEFMYGDCEESGFIIGIKTSATKVELYGAGGGALSVKTAKLVADEKWDQTLRDYCKLIDKPVPKFGWHLIIGIF